MKFSEEQSDGFLEVNKCTPLFVTIVASFKFYQMYVTVAVAIWF